MRQSQTTPSTQTQVAFAKTLQKEMEELGLHDVHYNEEKWFCDWYVTK